MDTFVLYTARQTAKKRLANISLLLKAVGASRATDGGDTQAAGGLVRDFYPFIQALSTSPVIF